MFANLLLITLLLLWTGMILGISFLESWVKFRAPSLTKPVALDVGRTVFGAFHKVQMVWLVLVLLTGCFAELNSFQWSVVIILTMIFLIQNFVFLPKLNHRATLIISGEQLPASSVHKFYAILELVKILLLLGLAGMLMIFYIPVIVV
jgi:hypothetical protein